MAKIPHDKYYTPQHIVDLVMKRVKEVVGLENITEFIEPSAGDGAFLDSLYATGIPTKAYDLYPERNDIVEQDYLELGLEYKKGRCVIGNPPFGKNTLVKSFIKNSYKFSDYICFILPVSQYNNNYQVYEFDLVYSEVLQEVEYSNKKVKCCFNVYKKPDKLNKKPNYKLKDVEIYEFRRNEREVPDAIYDFRMCSYGDIGKKVEIDGKYVKELCIKINKHKDKVLNVLKNTDWKLVVPPTTTPSLPQWQVYKYIKEQIPELE